jgi:AraC-like DNA-binding protein
MFPPDARLLSGEAASPQRLVDLHVPVAGLILPASAPTVLSEPAPGDPGHLLLLSPRARIACFHDGLAWHLEAGHYAWLTPTASLTLRPGALRGADLLAWSFTASTLPASMHGLLPVPGRAPAFGPAPLTPSMQTLVLALRSCPVVGALRALWSTGKLIELLTLLLPPPSAQELRSDGSPSLPAPARVIHPAIRAALDFMTARLAEPIGLPEIATAAHTSPSHLSRLFTAELGHGPTQHLRRLRLDHAAALLRSGQANVTEAALAAGYASLGQFSRTFAEHHGRSPSAFLPRNSG